MKYLNLVTEATEKKISKQLPCKFALMFDGWSHMSTHYVAIFASFNGPDEKCKTALLTFSPLLDESHLNAAGHVQLIEASLALYGKEWSNVVALIADNCELSKAISDQTNKPLIGCASHRFVLAVNKFIAGEMETVTKVNSLMVKLRTFKMSAKLREHTPLRPVLNSALQRENLYLSNVRMLFNETLKKFPELGRINEYIVEDASIVKSKHFENDIIKILEGRENEMKMTEKVQSGRLKKVEDDDSDSVTEENEDDFA